MTITAFFACVRTLADAVSSLPLQAYRKKSGVMVPVPTQPALLQSAPYPNITWGSWLWMLVESLAVTGNAFLYISSRDDLGRALALLPVNPLCIQVDIDDENDWTRPIYRINGIQVDSADVLHIRRYPLAGCPVGLSPIEKAATSVGLSLAADRYGLQYFRDSANPSGILSTAEPITEQDAKNALKRWIQAHSNRRIPAVLGSGLKWQPISITPEESQFLETRRFQRSEMAMWFGVPPHMLGDTDKSTSWGSGIDAQKNGFVTFTLEPWLNCIEDALSTLLPRGQQVKFSLEALLRGDPVAQWTGIQMGIQNGVLSINEGRAKQDLPPIKGGDIHLQPANFVELGYKPPADPGDTPPADSGEEGTK